VKVYDPTDQGIGPHGKQLLSPQSIYYTLTYGLADGMARNGSESLYHRPAADTGHRLELIEHHRAGPAGYRVTALFMKREKFQLSCFDGKNVKLPLFHYSDCCNIPLSGQPDDFCPTGKRTIPEILIPVPIC
jgi:hypothetical protein